MEDYALRYAPRSFRKWSEWRIANTALGSVSFLALEAIGAVIAVNYGFSNAMWAILAVGMLIFLTGIPIACYAARCNLDMDLLTRGAGFGYLGSTVTSLAYAVFTFAFFAIEAAIMVMAMRMMVDWPLPVCYVLSSLIIVPLVMRGVTWISRFQAWTQPVWLFLTIMPFVWLAFDKPQLYREFASMAGLRANGGGFQPLLFAAAAAVVFPLIVQIAEQVDYLRFMPPPRPGRRMRHWVALLAAGPGWIVPGMLKMAGGAFLAFVVMASGMSPQQAMEPPQMYLAAFREMFGASGLAIAATVLLVLVSQVKINVTNAYAGSLAWSNFFVRIAHNHPGRVVWLVFNVFIATLLAALGVFGAIEKILSLYGLVAAGWIGAVTADLVVNKPLRLSPPGIEFRRAYLHDFNTGLVAMLLAIIVGGLARGGAFGETARAFSSFIAFGTAFLLVPPLALATRGRYYLARQPRKSGDAASSQVCVACGNSFEERDMVHCPVLQTGICSLCCSLETGCRDHCKTAPDPRTSLRTTPRTPHSYNARTIFYLALVLLLNAFVALALAAIYVHFEPSLDLSQILPEFLKIFAALAPLAVFYGWWAMRAGDRRHVAQMEALRQSLVFLQGTEPQQGDAPSAPSPEPKDVAARAGSAGIPESVDKAGSAFGHAKVVCAPKPGEAFVPVSAEAVPLPSALRSALLRLARRGEVNALRQCLRGAREAHAAADAALAYLQRCVDRFDFPALIRYIERETSTLSPFDDANDWPRPLFRAPVILVVDDSIDTLAGLSEALFATGHAVLAARSATEALERFEIAVPDGALIDAVMPGINGFDLCRRIKSVPAWAHVPVIFMTDPGDEGQIVSSYLSGGADYMNKPLRIPEVLARLTPHLGGTAVRLARAAADIPDMGCVIVDNPGRIVWRSPQASRWLCGASGANGDAMRRMLDEAARNVEVARELPGGRRLLLRSLGASGPGEYMIVMCLDSSPAAQRLRQANLTPYETETFAWFLKGKDRVEVARIMGSTPADMAERARRIFDRLGIRFTLGATGQIAPTL
ncbi:MAG: response regulator [Azoarcus sp.]|jgi:CheY-like chemotaxis protein|nr:response regulator [Azoarcus sp.]